MRNVIGLEVRPGWAPPGCVTLDETRNLSEPQYITSLSAFPQTMCFLSIQSHCACPFYPSSPVPLASPHSFLPQSHLSPPPALRRLYTRHAVRCKSCPFSPLATGRAASPSDLSTSLLWSRPGCLFSWVCAAPSSLLTAPLPLPHLPSGSSRTIFLKWKAGCVMCLPNAS